MNQKQNISDVAPAKVINNPRKSKQVPVKPPVPENIAKGILKTKVLGPIKYRGNCLYFQSCRNRIKAK